MRQVCEVLVAARADVEAPKPVSLASGRLAEGRQPVGEDHACSSWAALKILASPNCVVSFGFRFKHRGSESVFEDHSFVAQATGPYSICFWGFRWSNHSISTPCGRGSPPPRENTPPQEAPQPPGTIGSLFKPPRLLLCSPLLPDRLLTYLLGHEGGFQTRIAGCRFSGDQVLTSLPVRKFLFALRHCCLVAVRVTGVLHS